VRYFVLIATLVATPLVAQTAGCTNPQTQSEMNRCSAEEMRATNRRLARLLAELRQTLDSASVSRLNVAQSAWEQFRTVDCEWRTRAYQGGSMASMAQSACLWALAEERILGLKHLLCEGGGGECEASHRYDNPRTVRRRP
jgi:uncharacterized protein YecT (DUF1311 family)